MPKELEKMVYGWVPDLPDRRDMVCKFALVDLPEVVDLRDKCSAIENQGSLGSCTAHALVGALEFNDVNDGDNKFTDLSRLFVYWNARKMEGTEQYNTGCRIRDGIKTLASLGVCKESLFQYDINAYAIRPPDACYEDAKERKIISYQRIITLGDMLGCLAEGFPFVGGMTVYESMESRHAAFTGEIEMPQSNERVVGGHAVLFVGFDRKKEVFIVRNSWGTQWGKDGYFTLPFDYFNLLSDMWVIRK